MPCEASLQHSPKLSQRRPPKPGPILRHTSVAAPSVLRIRGARVSGSAFRFKGSV